MSEKYNRKIEKYNRKIMEMESAFNKNNVVNMDNWLQAHLVKPGLKPMPKRSGGCGC